MWDVDGHRVVNMRKIPMIEGVTRFSENNGVHGIDMNESGTLLGLWFVYYLWYSIGWYESV